MCNQQKDKELIKIARNNNDYSIQKFHGVDKKYSLICKNCKTVIPCKHIRTTYVSSVRSAYDQINKTYL